MTEQRQSVSFLVSTLAQESKLLCHNPHHIFTLMRRLFGENSFVLKYLILVITGFMVVWDTKYLPLKKEIKFFFTLLPFLFTWNYSFLASQHPSPLLRLSCSPRHITEVKKSSFPYLDRGWWLCGDTDSDGCICFNILHGAKVNRSLVTAVYYPG